MQPLKLIKFEFEPYSRKDRNTAVILLTDFIVGMWDGYKNGIFINDSNLKIIVKRKMQKTRWILSMQLKECFSVHFNKK